MCFWGEKRVDVDWPDSYEYYQISFSSSLIQYLHLSLILTHSHFFFYWACNGIRTSDHCCLQHPLCQLRHKFWFTLLEYGWANSRKLFRKGLSHLSSKLDQTDVATMKFLWKKTLAGGDFSSSQSYISQQIVQFELVASETKIKKIVFR